MQEAQKIELLPCPFCGGEAEWDEWYTIGCDAFQVKCVECLATSCTGFINEKSLIAELWNKRYIPEDHYLVKIPKEIVAEWNEPLDE